MKIYNEECGKWYERLVWEVIRTGILIIMTLIVTNFFTPVLSDLKAEAVLFLSNEETLTFPLTAGTYGAVTKRFYTGTTIITVSGTGQVVGKRYSDAFYIYTDDNGQPISPYHNKDFFSLCINGQKVDHFIQTIPPPTLNHTYPFYINAPGGSLVFGVCDDNLSDNSGSFTVTLS